MKSKNIKNLRKDKHIKWRSTRLPNFRIKKKSVPVEVIERVTHYSCRVLSPKKFIEKELACLA